MEYEITMKVELKDDSELEDLKKTIDHHIERLVDLDSWQSIESIYDAKITKL